MKSSRPQASLLGLRRWRRLAGDRRGASVVEFAICAPVLFAFVFGIIELARMLQIQHTVREAALEGARAGVTLDAVTNDAITAATNVTSAVGIVNPTVTVTPITYTTPTITVTVTTTPGDNGLLLWFFTAGQPITGSITMTREVQGVSVP